MLLLPGLPGCTLGPPGCTNKIKYCLGKMFPDKTKICTRCGDGGGGGDMSKRKLSKQESREVRAKLQGIVQVLEEALTDNFLKERIFQQVSDAKEWAEDLEWMFR
jgi:hypothetical protein